MHHSAPSVPDRIPGQLQKPNKPPCLAVVIMAAVLAGLQGCAAVGNPVANGIPVRLVPPELLGESKEGMQTIPLTLLRQPPPPDYKLAAGDLLGIWIDGVLGEKGQPPVVRLPEPAVQGATTGFVRHVPAVGFPIPVRPNGTITLPQVPAIKVEGLTLEQAEEVIRKAYVDRDIVKRDRWSSLVTLQKPRDYHILVIRQDSTVEAAPSGPGLTGARATGFLLSFGGGARGVRRGAGYALDLPAYENDVLNALARTGGFPGSDAVNEIIIERGSFNGEAGRQQVVNTLEACPLGCNPFSLVAPGTQRIRIPLRYRPGQPPAIRPEDIVLQTGDIVYIEAREADVFYAAGLLPSGEYQLPRDTDLNVVQAILRIGGPVLVGGVNTANISGQLINPGLSLPNPTLVSVVRETPGGGQVTIRVDLDRALRDPRERILIQPRDLIVLQERPDEGFGRYLHEIFNFNFRYTFVNNPHSVGVTTFSGPQVFGGP
jgi:hypothetical protein